MIRVALVDDHKMFRSSLCLLLENSQKIKVVLQAENGEELLQNSNDKQIDVVVLDLQMPKMDGFKTIEYLHERHPSIKIIVLTHLTDINTLRKIIHLEANGFISKSAEHFELENAVQKVYKNGFYIEEDFLKSYQEILEKGFLDEIVITEKEIAIINLVIQEFSGKEIAEHLAISVKTVETHKRNLMQKTNSKNFMGVIMYALQRQLIKLPSINAKA